MTKNVRGSVRLPGSKSESNRLLMIAAYGGFPLETTGLSEAHDTVLLQQLLRQIAHAQLGIPHHIDCEDAGTVARFLLTYLSCREGEWVVTGSKRLQQRPMGPLIAALRQLGAHVNCLEREGQLPVFVKGHALEGGAVTVDSSQSSQFASSLLLAAPVWKKGLSLSLAGGVASLPYLEMSLSMMRFFGAEVFHDNNAITVCPGAYVSRRFKVAADWSSASSWYMLAALSDECSLLLEGLQPEGLQGDRKLVDFFENLGVDTRFEEHGARLVKRIAPLEKTLPLHIDISDTPDLFPALFSTCVALHVPAVFHGTRNLSLKESDRVESMILELSKLYTFINIIEDNEIVVEKSFGKLSNPNNHIIEFDTHLDHRIAMALAPFKLRLGSVSFDHPEVVAKSYPGYWAEFEKVVK